MDKLVIFAPSFYPHSGGVEKHLANIVRLLTQKKYKVTVFVRYYKGFPARQKFYGADVVRMPKSSGRVALGTWYIKNKKLLENAIIHSHDYFPLTIRILLKKNRWVHTFHGYEGYPLDTMAIESRKRVAKSVDYTFCVGKFIEKWYGTTCNQIIWGAAEKPKAIKKLIKYDFIFFGRFEEDTGFEKYIEAFKLIKSKVPSATMVVVGWGSKASWARQYSLNNRLGIIFKEPVKNVYLLLAQSRVAFVSGYQAIIESALMKKPIVAYYDTPIKKDYLGMHPMSRYLNISNRSSQIADKAILLLSSPGNKNTDMYNWANSQSWKSIVNKYEESYKS